MDRLFSSRVIGIQSDISKPHVAVDYSVPLSSRTGVNCLTVDNGLVCINHCRRPSGPDLFEFGVLDLERRTVLQFSVSTSQEARAIHFLTI